MEPLLTNAWATVRPGLSGRTTVSAVVLESTLPPRSWRLLTPDPLHPCLELEGLYLNFPPVTLPGGDGLIQKINISQDPPSRREQPPLLRVSIDLQHPADPQVSREENIPCRLVCWFDRHPVRQLLAGCRILIDPGHGGRDPGGRGPINLLEKNVALRVARYLEKELRTQGANPELTREDDRDLPLPRRFAAARAGRAQLVVSLHTAQGKDREERGIRTLSWTCHELSRLLAEAIQRSLLASTGFRDRGVKEIPPPDRGVRVPSVTVEMVCLSNPIEEAWLRSSTFRQRLAQAITCGIKDFLACSPAWPPSGRGAGISPPPPVFMAVPVRTHVLSERDDMVETVARFTRGIAEAGDVICIAESPLAVTQGRAVLASQVKAGLAARILRRFPDPDGSLGTPAAMQLALREVGLGRILLGGMAAALGRMAGRRGDFFRVAGQTLALIDDIAGTMPPYDRHVVLGPQEPQQVAEAIKKATGVDALVADVNDIRCVDILGNTAPYPTWALIEALRSNPFGNDDQCTPIVVLKPVRRDR